MSVFDGISELHQFSATRTAETAFCTHVVNASVRKCSKSREFRSLKSHLRKPLWVSTRINRLLLPKTIEWIDYARGK